MHNQSILIAGEYDSVGLACWQYASDLKQTIFVHAPEVSRNADDKPGDLVTLFDNTRIKPVGVLPSGVPEIGPVTYGAYRPLRERQYVRMCSAMCKYAKPTVISHDCLDMTPLGNAIQNSFNPSKNEHEQSWKKIAEADWIGMTGLRWLYLVGLSNPYSISWTVFIASCESCADQYLKHASAQRNYELLWRRTSDGIEKFCKWPVNEHG